MIKLEHLDIDRPSETLDGIDYKEVRDLEFALERAINLILMIGDNNEQNYEFYEMDSIEEFCSQTLNIPYSKLKKLYKKENK